MKLIALLRNPVDRAYSQHQMNVRKGIEPLSFDEAIAAEPERLRGSDRSDEDSRTASYFSYLGRGRYAEQLQRWFDHFPRERLLILKSEDFFHNPEAGVQRTLDFLNLPPWHPTTYKVHNPGDYDDMPPETRARLSAYFAPHNHRLYDLLGEDVGWEAQRRVPETARLRFRTPLMHHVSNSLADSLALPRGRRLPKGLNPPCWDLAKESNK